MFQDNNAPRRQGSGSRPRRAGNRTFLSTRRLELAAEARAAAATTPDVADAYNALARRLAILSMRTRAVAQYPRSWRR